MTARPERVPAEQVRQRMLDAGRELALETGVALTIEQLRLEEVIQRARVPRSSVYRLWPYREEYIDDLLCYLAGTGSWFSERPVLDPATFDDITTIVDGNRHLLATEAGRRGLLREAIRVATARNYAALTESAPWRLHMALVATLGSTRADDARARIAAALEDAQRRSRETMVAMLGYLTRELGMRLRDPAYTLDHVQLAGGMLVQSLALRNVQVQAMVDDPGGAACSAEAARVNELLNTAIPGPGLAGEPAQWSLAALAYLNLIEGFIEPDPCFTPPGPGPAPAPGR